MTADRAVRPVSRAGPVVVGVDGGPSAGHALRLAAGLVRPEGSALVVLHVVEPLCPVSLWAAVVGLGVLPREDYALESFLQAAAVLDPLGVRWRLLVRHGSPAVALHGLAEELAAAAVVVGAGSGSRPLLRRRGTAARLRRLSARPVLVAGVADGERQTAPLG